MPVAVHVAEQGVPADGRVAAGLYPCRAAAFGLERIVVECLAFALSEHCLAYGCDERRRVADFNVDGLRHLVALSVRRDGHFRETAAVRDVRSCCQCEPCHLVTLAVECHCGRRLPLDGKRTFAAH